MAQADTFRDLNPRFPFGFAPWAFDRWSDRSSGAWLMPMDAFRRGNDVWVHIDLPGVRSENLDITVDRNVLTIEGERQWQQEDGDQPYFGERYRGSFRRQIQLGDDLDLDHLEADLTEGVLTLRIPVAEQAQPRKISVGQGQAVQDRQPEALETAHEHA